MRASLLIVFYVVFFIPSAFANSFSQTSSKGIVPQDWSGFYTGLLLGAQFGTSSDKTGTFGYNANNDKWDYNSSGYNAGAEFGSNFRWHQFVAGPEIELGYLRMQGSGAQPKSPGSDTLGKSDSDFYTTFRARLGLALEHSLLFGTAGAIGVNYAKQVIDSCSIAPCGGSTVNAQKTSFVWGYLLGGGFEQVFKKGWSAKFECLYFNLNNDNFSGTTNLGNTYEWTGNTLGYIVRGGLNYHF